MKAAMKVITIGKRLISVEQIAFVEPFDPAANPDFKPEKDFKARLVLLNRDIVLTEDTVEAFAEAQGLHLLAEDHIAVNRGIVFKVEVFEPKEGFTPAKPFQTRLKWSDTTGAQQSKLLVMPPEAVIAELSARRVSAEPAAKGGARRPARSRKAATRPEACQG